MSELVLVSHGQFCTELKKSAEMIMGPQENIHTVELLPSEGPEDFKAKFDKTVEGLGDFTVFADLMGGTPANVVARILMEGEGHFDLFTGMNLPMIISFINAEMVGGEPNIVDDAKAGVVHVNEMLS
ncbi:MAG: PTS sugar transporter subunit IIA [Lactobacillus sp.]|jgi:PTS system mannose-specific IIA component|uniref:PTS sugar transporter subunit IIA n=1 Tax=Lacticaseibacillus suilingensis TaxID=2799577 RepID=A0ABW4BEG6_9LACO|nr:MULTISPECIES: PTS sugar transporter subunit IIA [Lacticaseibacillus]MCI1894934.1 PTS sugar transporter subunit IIA [Lactobacillus sp.]MCI1917190.1 PTS sugar transporter subunit IIA [Lactobacillus sp.]MCI1942199.1 PTS sugar transporter subunit IIA [Lactobacillus sp.]MCI1972641.1 PTS sugar transporter subunit IIA [Lactobacillus sp.]MCI2017422.1 PTS sugar transporter subunit IIA [Lactobacillus sp.]